MTENTSTTIDLVFVNILHHIASHGVQDFRGKWPLFFFFSLKLEIAFQILIKKQ